MPKGARSDRVSSAMNGAVIEVSGKKHHWGWEFLPGSRARMFLVLMAEGGQKTASRFVACWSFWMPKGARRNRVSRAMNGAMLEVSGKKHHSGLGGFAWEQGLEFLSSTAKGGQNPASRTVACRSFWMPEGARSPRVVGP